MDPRKPCAPEVHAAQESGQAIVEAAFMLPLMIFFILCTLQLTLMQQARINAEYAVFNAARTGVVHNMDNGTDGSDFSLSDPSTMRNAAVMSILPSYGPTDTVAHFLQSKVDYEVEDALLHAAGIPMIKVTVLNPHVADFNNFGAQLNKQEIDFDDMRPTVARATLLSIELRYMYELRIPFANQMIEAIYISSQTGLLKYWTGPNAVSSGIVDGQAGNAVALGTDSGLALGIVTDGIKGGLDMSAVAVAAKVGRFYFPLYAYYTMRMQSNPYKQWAAP